MQYIPPNMKTDMRLHHSIQHDEMECRHLGLSTFWCVYVLACRRCGLSTFWSVDVLVCRRFGLSTFWFVDVLVCRRFGLSTFRFVDVLVCRRFGCRRFGLSTFWPVTIPINGFHQVKIRNSFFNPFPTFKLTQLDEFLVNFYEIFRTSRMR